MTTRTSIIGALSVLCLGLLWATFSQGQRLEELRAEQNHILAGEAAPASPAVPESASQPEANPEKTDSAELLQLRNEVNRLTRRKQELASVQREHQQLQTQLASAATNHNASLPAGYVRKAEAQNLGSATPEATLQTFLWALQQKDAKTFLDLLTPESAEKIQQAEQRGGHSVAEMFGETQAIPGLRVVKTESINSGEVLLSVEIMPGADPTPMYLRQVNGLWKMDFNR
jgi:hypothetical protein